MMIPLSILLLLFLAPFLVAETGKDSKNFLAKIQHGLEIAHQRVKYILDEFQVNNYPNFLKSCYMHKLSWEIMKWKFMRKILRAHLHKNEKFVISFTGSSVTAGHDSKFNESTSEVTGQLMTSVLSAMDVALESRNVALGNNPCSPYDVCVKFFVGYDADIAIWEQNYFCTDSPMVEQFIRQAMLIPTRPIIAFSQSNTAHWGSNECKERKGKTKGEEELLSTNVLKLVSEVNKDSYHNTWGFIGKIGHKYHGAAIQTFTHDIESNYACNGPYIKTWQEGAVSWHPSVLGHKLRASHHSYFWLNNWVNALTDLSHFLQTKNRSTEAILKDIEHKLENSYTPLHHEPHYNTPFVDNIQCFTDYEPRAVRNSSLKDLVISGLSTSNDNNPGSSTTPVGWKFLIYEDLVDTNLVKRSQKNGYKDFKYLMYSPENAGPLTVALNIPRPGPLFMCQTPGIWGSLPKGFSKLYEADIKLYITLNIPSKDNFQFQIEKAVRQNFTHTKLLDLCVQLKDHNTQQTIYAPGNHALTVIPDAKTHVIFAWLITP